MQLGVSPWSQVFAPSELEEQCADSIDNDSDGTTDCDDVDCAVDSECMESGQENQEICGDRADNDMDGQIDEANCTEDGS